MPATLSNPSPSTSGSASSGNMSKKIVAEKATTTNITVHKNDSHVNKPTGVELDFSIVDELKWTRASISLFELEKIAQFRNEIVNSLPRRMPNLPQQFIMSIDTQDSVGDGSAIR